MKAMLIVAAFAAVVAFFIARGRKTKASNGAAGSVKESGDSAAK